MAVPSLRVYCLSLDSAFFVAQRAELVSFVWTTYVQTHGAMRELNLHLAQVRQLKFVSDEVYKSMIPSLNEVTKHLGKATQTSYAMLRQCLTEAEREELRQRSVSPSQDHSPEPSRVPPH